MKRIVAGGILAWTTSAALADDNFRNQETLSSWASATASISGATGDFRGFQKDPKPCGDAIAALRKAGVAKVSDFAFKPWGGKDLTLDQAAKICTDAEHWYALARHLSTFDKVVVQLNILADAPNPEGLRAKSTDLVKECNGAVNAITAAKFPPETPFIVYGIGGAANPAKTVGELKANLCDAIAPLQSKSSNKQAEERAAAVARYAKAGITGDKLDFMMEYGANAFLPGGAAPDDLKRYGAASTLFVWTTSDPDDAGKVLHTVRRYTFKNNKLVNQSEKTYRKPKGAKLGNVFK